jgi:hypothetical protein
MAVQPLERALECAALQPAVHDTADLVALDESRFFEDVQVLDESGQRHAERIGKIADRALAVTQPREHRAPCRVGKRAEDRIEAAAVIVNHLVHFIRAGQGCQVQLGMAPAPGRGDAAPARPPVR